jgi:hypothetical protein
MSVKAIWAATYSTYFVQLMTSVAERLFFDAEPNPDRPFHFNADPDQTLHFDGDPDPAPTFNMDADPVSDANL